MIGNLIRSIFLSPRSLIFLVAGSYVLFIGILFHEAFSIPTDVLYITREFQSSNYALGEQGKTISDGVVYTYAGYEYARGISPTRINFEHPPMVKYLFGWSIQFFETHVPVSFFFFSLYIFVLTAIGFRSFRSITATALFLFLLFTNELGYGFSTDALLDLPMTALMLLGLYLADRFREEPKRWWFLLASGVAFGLSMSAKYPFPLTIGIFGLVMLWILYTTRAVRLILFTTVLAVMTYGAWYIPEFILGSSILDHLRFEWWRVQWYMGKVAGVKGLMLQTVLFGQHASPYVPSGTIVYGKYSWLWPTSFLGFMYALLILRDWISGPYLPWKIWTLGAFTVFLLGASHDFYLVPLMPGFVFFFVQSIDPLLLKLQLWCVKICGWDHK